MKTTILAILAAALCACANDKAYWQVRQAAVYQLPREQRTAAQIELMREQHNEQQIHQQQAVDTANATVTPVVPAPAPQPIAINQPLGVAASRNLLLVTQWQDQRLLSLDADGNAVALAIFPGDASEQHYPAIAPSQSADAGFTAGNIFVTQENKIYRVVGSTVTLFATVTDATLLGGITFDHIGTFGHNMIVVSEEGGVWKVNGTGTVTSIASLSTRLEGPAIAPSSFGSLGGQILAADGNAGQVHAIASDGTVTSDVFDWYGAVSVTVIPDSLRTFLNGGAFFQVIYSNTIQPYPPSRFAGESGILISSEAGAGIAIASFNGTDYDLGLWDHISGAQFEGSAFVDCDVP